MQGPWPSTDGLYRPRPPNRIATTPQAKKYVQSAQATTKTLQTVGLITEASVAGIRSVQGAWNLYQSGGRAGYGQIGEAILRVFGVHVMMNARAAEAARAARTSANASDVANAMRRLDTRRLTPRSGLDKFFDATSRMQGVRRFGEKLSAERIVELRKALADEGIWLNLGKVDDAGNAIIRFRPYGNGRAERWLPENATAYEALHDVSHAIHWMRLGKDYRAWTGLSKIERERWVFQYIERNHWQRLNYMEQFDAWEQFWRAPAD